jgi:hypothetical protein
MSGLPSIIEPYLEGPHAEADVAAVLAADFGQDVVCHNRIWFWRKERDHAWTYVALHWPGPRSWGCYYRPDGDRFIVTDLGEGVRVMRLRTGYVGLIDDLPYEEVPGAPMICDGRLIGVTVPRDENRIPAADLPRTIARVLLASRRVARLEGP